MIEDAVEDLIGLAMQALNLSDPEGDEQGSNYGKDFSTFKLNGTYLYTLENFFLTFSMIFFMPQ